MGGVLFLCFVYILIRGEISVDVGETYACPNVLSKHCLMYGFRLLGGLQQRFQQ